MEQSASNKIIGIPKIYSGLKKIAAALIDGFDKLLWPCCCLNCLEHISNSHMGLCQDCWQELSDCVTSDYCPSCGREAGLYSTVGDTCRICRKNEFSFEAIARAGIYKDTLRDLILKFKFSDAAEFAPLLAKLCESALAGSEFVNEIDLFVPVPLHWKRRLLRGYNQSLLLCKAMPCAKKRISNDLVRVKNTPQQTTLTLAGRKKNVKGAFAVRPDHKFQDAAICLVDDITTSRSTLHECALTLKRAGAKKVFALTVSTAMHDPLE
jgi:ComF family protein